jgi:hypothetical protein
MDFMAMNPPRYGVQWLCPMDVAIRVANIALAVDLLTGNGLGFAQDTMDVIARSIREHAIHVARYLEWDETKRGNHYLANLVGLLWASSRLRSDPQMDALLAFSASELLHEGVAQFGADGGNYEGSTNYHRLSGEFLLFGVALLVSLGRDGVRRIARARQSNLGIRVPWRAEIIREMAKSECASIVPAELVARIHRAGDLARAMTRPDGRVVQIGDNDSGRLFKLGLAGWLTTGPGGSRFVDDPLDHRSFVASVQAMFSPLEDFDALDAVLIRQLVGTHVFARPALSCGSDVGCVDDVIAAMVALPSHRRRTITFPEPVPLSAWRRTAFREFGLYLFSTNAYFLAFRCSPQPPLAAPLGHRHDDNLGIEYLIDDHRRVDPGSFCYTSSVERRDRYRRADAHDVPRAVGWDVAAPGDDLFDLHHAGWAECLAWQENGVAGQIVVGAQRLMRAIHIDEREIEVWDAVTPPDRLRDISSPIVVATGYGTVDHE